MKVELMFIEPLLGTQSGDPEITKEFITSKHPEGEQQDELDSLPETIEKKSTIFAREDSRPFLWNYMIKGFFKNACSVQLRIAKDKELRAYKKIVDTLIFIEPRKIFLQLPGELTWFERPLRGQTAQGERIALARSETAPISTKIEFEIILLKPGLDKYIRTWLDYGRLMGLGQWRSGGFGSFTWRELQ